VDITGRVMLEKAFRRLGAGRHNLTLSADGVPSGVYFLRAQIGERKVGRKVAVMK